MSRLDPGILEYLSKKTGKAPKTIRNHISALKQRYPNCTQNAIAHLFAQEHGLSVLKKLNEEDRATIPNIEVEKPTTIRQKAKKSETKLLSIVDFKTDDYFIQGHVKEINKAYGSGCFTCVYVLFRKLVENLLIDILRFKFPEEGGIQNKELYFNVNQNRYHDFSIILDNLNNQKVEFHHNEKKNIERIIQLCKPFKKDANDKAHSLFHLVESRIEIDNLCIEQITALIKQLYESVKN